MQAREFHERMQKYRIIASLKEHKSLEKALKAPVSAVALSVGNIGNIIPLVKLYKSNGIPVFVHIERIGGLSLDDEGMAFLANCVKPDGIVTTRNHCIRQAKKEGLLTIQRVFLFDSDSVRSGISSVRDTKPDAVEVMPALLMEYISLYQKETGIPIIAGGLIQSRDHIVQALQSGAAAVSTSSRGLWKEPVTLEPEESHAVAEGGTIGGTSAKR